MSELKQGIVYHIEPTATVAFTGAEFINSLNILARVLASPKYQEDLATANTVAAIGSLHEAMNNKLKEMVDTGIATEVVPEQPSNNIPLGPQTDAHIMD